MLGTFKSLRQEMTHPGIQSIEFKIGFFQAKFMHTDIFSMGPSKIDDYGRFSSAVAHFVTETSGKQPGNPKKAVEIMVVLARIHRRCK